MLLNLLERFVRWLVVFITNFLPVKVIRDDRGKPFLYRYHLFALTKDGPGICFHHFVGSDPDRGYHDHPWSQALSFILCGKYSERIVNKDTKEYQTFERNRFTFNYLKGEGVFHRVMLEPGQDAWTVFFFRKRSKTWGMVTLNGDYKPMSTQIEDQDGGWWHNVMKGLGVHSHLEHEGKVVATVDSIIVAENKILLIRRGKEPYKGCWAFPGGRIEQKDQDMLSAAYRELKEETSLEDVKLRYITTVGNNYRDPRGFCITNVFLGLIDRIPDKVKAGDDAVDYMWYPLNDLPDMAFDHRDIIDSVLLKQHN